MLKTTIGEVYHCKVDCRFHCIYMIRDEDVIMYVGQSVDIQKRLQAHIGFDRVGEVICYSLPQSLGWTMELYSLNDCDALLNDCYLDVDSAEFDIIVHFKPCLNELYNRDKPILPERYYDSKKIVNAGIRQSEW